MTVSEYIFDFLSQKGIDTAFVVTGGQAMWLNDALAKNKKIHSIFCHHEQSCGMSADAYGRITNKLGLAVVTAGPGSINVVNGLVGGWTDSSPMMVVSGQSALSCVKYQEESGIRQYGIQGIFIKPFVEKACKFFVTVDDPTKIKYYLEKAYYLAKNGRPGPVWIDVPLDIQRMQVPENLTYSFQPEEDYVNVGRMEQAKQILSMIASAKRPIIIAGQGVRLAGASDMLREFAERFRLPIITTRLGIDLIESDHELFVGRPGNYGDRPANFAIQNADFILAIGSRLATAAVGHDARNFGKHAVKVVVDVDPKELEKPSFKIDHKICDDANKFLDALLKGGEYATRWCSPNTATRAMTASIRTTSSKKSAKRPTRTTWSWSTRVPVSTWHARHGKSSTVSVSLRPVAFLRWVTGSRVSVPAPQTITRRRSSLRVMAASR